MTIEIKDGRYFLGFWTAGNTEFDVLAACWRDDESVAVADSWRFVYRFRYHVDDELFERSKDVKNWHACKLKGNEEMVEATIGVVLSRLLVAVPRIDFLPVHSDRADDAMRVLNDHPSMHVEDQITEEEFQRRFGHKEN